MHEKRHCMHRLEEAAPGNLQRPAQPRFRRSTRNWATSTLAGLAILVLGAACGESSDQRSGDPTRVPVATTSPTTQPDVALPFKELDFPVELTNGQSIGDVAASLTLTVFEDFQCPFCLRFTLVNEPVIIQEYVLTGKIRFEFKHFPILGQESGAAAIAAACAADQGQFWKLHKRLFLAQFEAGQMTSEKLNVGRFTVTSLQQMAKDESLNMTAFNECLSGEGAITAVANSLREATTLGLRGTPSFLVNGRPVSGPPTSPAEWRTFLDAQLKATR